jgi:type IV secretory pathway VirB10-like protein
MNLRCIYCQTPFTLSRTEMLGAIISMNEKSQNHYDAHCPRCRRANSISRQRMELFFPNWQEAAKQQAAAPAAPPPMPASTSLRTEPVSKAMKAAVAKQTAAKASAAASSKEKKSAPVAKKPSAKKTTAGKPASKKAPAKGKKK